MNGDGSAGASSNAADVPRRAGVAWTLVLLAAAVLLPAMLLVLIVGPSDVPTRFAREAGRALAALAVAFALMLVVVAWFVRARSGATGAWVRGLLFLAVACLALLALTPVLPAWIRHERALAGVALSSIGVWILLANRTALRSRAWWPPLSALGMLAGVAVAVSPLAVWFAPGPEKERVAYVVAGALLVWLFGLLTAVGSIPTVLAGTYVLASALRFSTLPSPQALAARLDAQRDEVLKLEAVARQLDGFRTAVMQLEAELSTTRCRLPETMQLDSFEGELRAALAAEKTGDVEISRDGFDERHRGTSAQKLLVAAPEAAVSRALARVCRHVQVLQGERAGARTKTTLRVFAKALSTAAAERPARPEGASIPLPWLVFDPFSWSRAGRVREHEAALLVTNRRLVQLEVVRRQVAAFQEKERLLRERKDALVALERPGVGDLQVTELIRAGDAWTARVRRVHNLPEAPDGAEGATLSAGSRLYDGVVRSVASDHLIVEADVPVSGEPPIRRLLRFSPPQRLPRLTLGSDTTRILSPLLSDGTPDYGRWLNEKYGAGVTAANNAAPPLARALAALVDAGQTFFDGSPGGSAARWFSEPWREADCAVCVERLRKNEAALAAVAEAVQRTRFYMPRQSGTHVEEIRVPSLLQYRHAANALAGRGMLRLANHDFEGARKDALTIQRLAVLLSQGPTLIERLIAIAIRGIGAPLLPLAVREPTMSAAGARGLLRELVALPPLARVADSVDDTDRVGILDQVLLRRQRSAERGPGSLLESVEPQWLQQLKVALPSDQLADADPEPPFGHQGHPVAYLIPVGVVDWEEGLRAVNHEFDLSVAAMRATTPEELGAARRASEAASEAWSRETKAVLATFRAGVRSEQTKAADIAEAAEALARTPQGRKRLAALVVPHSGGLHRSAVAQNEADAIFRLDVTSIALAVRRLETGRHPENLDALGPDLLPGRYAPGAALGGYRMRYEPAPAGAYALTAVPEQVLVSGNRGFCVDSAGASRVTTDGTAPKLVGGVCDPKARLLMR